MLAFFIAVTVRPPRYQWFEAGSQADAKTAMITLLAYGPLVLPISIDPPPGCSGDPAEVVIRIKVRNAEFQTPLAPQFRRSWQDLSLPTISSALGGNVWWKPDPRLRPLPVPDPAQTRSLNRIIAARRRVRITTARHARHPSHADLSAARPRAPKGPREHPFCLDPMRHSDFGLIWINAPSCGALAESTICFWAIISTRQRRVRRWSVTLSRDAARPAGATRMTAGRDVACRQHERFRCFESGLQKSG